MTFRDGTSINSSYLKSAVYDPKERHLTVGFHDGSTWRYHGVSHEIMAAFHDARSKGGFFREHIRGIYRGEKV